MKRLLALLLSLIYLTASAQVEHSIVLDSNSFRAVQTDALTGVNIDPIGMDLSRQPCARVKIFFHRMTREQMEQLEPKFPSGTIDCIKRKVADDNTVLILEFTAKPSTKFYLNHPTFGVSNEVEFDFEGGREYQLEASLNQTFSIVVNSNEPNVDIYLDNRYRGQTDASNSLTIKDVMIGAHKLKVTYGSISYEQEIDVNSGSISFRQDVNKAANKPQYVVFAVEPKNSAVTIDGQLYVAEDGVVVALLQNGQHNYKVEARGYHSQSGTVTVAGAKIERAITLKEDFATVTLTAESGADIYVNDKKVGTTSWSGRLNSGLYIFEARKSGYRTQSLTRQITSDSPAQSFALPALEPIYGSADITSTPPMADITIDGKSVGRTPLQLDNLLVGEHKLTVSKSDYQPYAATITIAEGKTATVNATLTKQSTQTTSTSTQPTITKSLVKRGSITTAPYKIGDYYNDGKKEGVVFEVSADGRSGKIVSMKQSAKLRWFGSYINISRSKIGADSDVDGMYNMEKVMAISGWQDTYPAFKWCADLGKGWYLPSIEELKKILFRADFDIINTTIKSKGGTPIDGNNFYWSSTEATHFYGGKPYQGAKYAGANIERVIFVSCDYCVRAVAKFEDVSNVQQNLTAVKTYKVGDYYNDGKKEGIVFEVWDDGKSGKIVSTVQADLYLQGDPLWGGTSSECTTFLGAEDCTYGMSNQRVIQSRPDWEKNYPMFKWCADLGEGWYLPAIDELIKLTLDDVVYQKVNSTLNLMGKTPLNQRGTKSIYISSTECRYASLKSGNTTKNHTHYYSCWYTSSLLKMYNFIIKCGITSGDVRAVAVFGDINSANRVVEPNFRDRKPTKAPYKVGDYYNENGKEGVVFEVGANGYSGKIVALNKIKSTSWCSDDKKCKKIVGASSRSDGEENMRAVQQQKKWQEYYPAFAACADLGSGWYIPAINELNAIFAVKNKIDFTLVSKGVEQLYIANVSSDIAISSTESDSPTGIWYLFLYYSQPRTSSMHKRLSGSVYPVAKF